MPPLVGASEFSAAIANPMMDDMLRNPNANIPAMLKEYQAATNDLLRREPGAGDAAVKRAGA